MATSGHTIAQKVHPVQVGVPSKYAIRIPLRSSCSANWICPFGQTQMHKPHPLHRSSSMIILPLGLLIFYPLFFFLLKNLHTLLNGSFINRDDLRARRLHSQEELQKGLLCKAYGRILSMSHRFPALKTTDERTLGITRFSYL